jgi:1,2-diacylglycerol 3-beta-glucosyltransferase
MHEFHSIVQFALLPLIGLPATLACGYLLILTLLSRRSPSPAALDESTATQPTYFDIIVPAHDEAGGVADTVANLRSLDWPSGRFRVIVVADNCADATARIAREAGATVLERTDLVNRGKGYALAHAFRWSRADGEAEAVVVVDADSKVSRNLLHSFAVRIQRGASALQVHYGVLNAGASWRTRLMSIALGSIHKLRSRARERLALSCGIRGNGWCVTHALLDKVPYQAFSLTEDVEFGVDLGLAGYRVAYCDEAEVRGEMVTSEQAARSQRQRWEGGRMKLISRRVPALINAALTRPSAICCDLAIDLLVLPLSYILLNIAAFIAAVAATGAASSPVFVAVAAFDCVALTMYVGRGWMLSEVGLEGFWDLLRVPSFVFWKVVLVFSGPKSTDWIRTRRERR